MDHRPTIQQLEAFVAVARTLSFRQAADELFVSQPALSAQIKKLEAACGVELFERDRRRVLLSSAGADALERAKRILADADEFVAAARAAEDPLAGTMRLGVIPTVAPYALPRVLPPIRARWPELRWLVREDQTHRLLKWLRDGTLDLVLLAIDVDLGQLETLALFDDAFVVALPKGHPLSAKAELTADDLADQEVLLLEEGHCLADQAGEVCRESASAVRVGDFRATSLATLVQMVAGGIGVTLLPEMAVPDLSRAADVVIRPFATPAPSRSIGFAWRPGSVRAAGFGALAEVVEGAL